MSAPETVVTLFAGPGGCCTGTRWAGWTGRNVGYDHDAAACATAETAGHERVQADVAALDPMELHGDDNVVGMGATPPCPSFSTAGQGAGRKLIAILAEAITDAAHGRYDRHVTVLRCARVLFPHAPGGSALVAMRTSVAQRWAWALRQAEMSALVVEPMRWAYALRPRFIVLEQVPPVLVLWQHMAIHLRGMGYSVWTGVLDAEMYGVPQTRDRAILSADLDATVSAPEPTHQRYRPGKAAQTEPDLFGDPLPPPVSMAEALGWDTDTVVRSNYSTGGDTANPGMRPASAPAAAVTSKVDRNVVLRAGERSRGTERGGDEPAPTVLCSRTTNLRWSLRNGTQDNAATRSQDEPAGTIFFGQRANAVDWVRERPATTVCGDARLGAPGHRDRAGGELQFGADSVRSELQFGADSVRVSVAEAGVLQSFPPDYPWQGTKTQQYRQVGDAVPPLLFMHIVRPRLAVQRPATRSDVA